MRKILFIAFVLLAVSGFTQEYKFNIFTIEEGLPQPYVYDMAQAKNGFLYIATGDGLAVYGGNKFKTLTIKDGLAENFCNTLHFDSKQRLWVGHFEGGISYLENSKFHTIETKDFQSAKVVSIVEDDKQNIYYATAAGGINVIKNNIATPFTKDELPPINEIKIHNGFMYVASQSGLLMFDLSQSVSVYKTIPGTENKNITCLDINRANELWLGVDEEGIELFKQENKNYKLIRTITSELSSQRKNIKDIYLKSNSEAWVSLSGEGLRDIKLKENYDLEKQNKIGDKNGLKSLFINKIFIDSEENLWFGSYGGGLFQFLSARFELFNHNNVIPFDNIKSVAIDDSNNVFISDEKRLFVFNSTSKAPLYNGALEVVSEEEIRSSYLNELKNELWIGTNKNLFVYDFKNGKLKLKNKLTAFNEKVINYISKNLEGQLLICTNEGLYFLNDKNEIQKRLTTENKLPHNNISSCFVDKADHMYLFSPYSPLTQIYGDDITLMKDIDTVSTFRFNSATEDNNGNIWFGTDGDGVYLFTKNQKTNHYTTETGLISDFIYDIVLTDKGDVIACHKNGMSIKYANLKKFKPLNKSNGLPATCFNMNASYKDKKGNIWLGSTEGLVKYDPTEDKINFYPPVFSLLSILTNDSLKDLNDTLYHLPYSKYELVINFIGVSLTNPGGVTYRYKLEGFEEKWQTTSEGKITYPKLTDGEYRFVIYAKNSDGFENPIPKSFTIIIKEPFWKKTWFFIVAFFVLVFGFITIFRIRTVSLRNAKIELETQVKNKTVELVQEKERVEKANILLEEINHDITSSISYAQRIQNAVLPHTEYIHENLDLFIFYRPRDIVSGDFYWYADTPNFIYVAAVDCTGHGVPGAFMSLLGSTYLDQVLIENTDLLPSLILHELDNKIQTAFRQKNPEDKIGDGMDMMLCRISKNKNEIVFSGANRPIYYFSKKGFEEIKSPVFSIGGFFASDAKEFFDTTYNFEKGDCFYMFSDGYGDQFGGEKYKRYSTRRMKDLFEKIKNEPSETQKVVLSEEFDKWKGTHEQIDDVLVIGIKL